jgi:cytochrome P450
VLAAPSHPDPFPWYAQLAEAHPGGLFLDAGLGLWVACDQATVDAGLAHPLLHVRPPDEPVPGSLVGRPTGAVFAQLVRMREGGFHQQHKPRVARAVEDLQPGVAEAASAAAADLFERVDANAWLTAVPVQAMARVLGVAPAQRDATVAHVHAFTRGIAAGATLQELDAADAACEFLMAQGRAAGLEGPRAANRIACMQQALDATAGLIGNALARLACGGEAALDAPAVHNTRRWASEDCELAGQPLRRGQGVVLLLVSAGRGFGGGRHACPGERIARAIAAAAVEFVRAEPGRLARFRQVSGYRPLPNARIPVF